MIRGRPVRNNKVKRYVAGRGRFQQKRPEKTAHVADKNPRGIVRMEHVVFFLYILCSGCPARAAVNLDRTRIIFDAAEPSVSLTVTNDDSARPFLAQAWVEDSSGKKSTDLLVTIPPVQRIEPGGSSLVRITAAQAAGRLPRDKESLFYFNLRGIPPRAENSNVLQIALQTRIKLFYRPEALRLSPGSRRQDSMSLRRIYDGYEIANPGPYYTTVVSLKNQGQPDNDMTPLMLAPGGHARLSTTRLARPVLTYINDFGGRNEVSFHCEGERCEAEKR